MTPFAAMTHRYREFCFSIQTDGFKPIRYVVAIDIEHLHLSSHLIDQHGTIYGTFLPNI